MSQIKIFILFLLIATLTTLNAQEAPQLFAFGQVDMGSSKGITQEHLIYKINGETASSKVVSSITDQAILKQCLTFNPIDKVYLFWTKRSEKYELHTLEVETGKVFTYPYQLDYPLQDVQFDLRNKTYFGLRYARKEKALQVIQITNTAASVVAQFPDVRGITLGATAFDSNRGVYIFAANDKNYNERLYTIDLSTKTILDNAKISNFYFSEIQYDVQDSKTYAICRKKTNTNQYFFVELDLAQARPVIIAPIFGLKSLETNNSAFDQKLGVYYFKGKDESDTTRLYMLDAMSGDVIFRSSMDLNLYHVDGDNSKFANEYFKETSVDNLTSTTITTKIRPIKEYSNEIPDENVITLLTPVVQDILTLNIDLPESTGITVDITSITGERVFSKKIFNRIDSEKNTVDLTTLEAGLYLIEFKTEDKIYSKKLVKR